MDIHISTARKILTSPDPFNIKFWDKTGSLIEMKNCVGLRSAHYAGVRNIKCLTSGEIRKVRDHLIYSINDQKIFI